MINEDFDKLICDIASTTKKAFAFETPSHKPTIPAVFVRGLCEYDTKGHSIGIFNKRWKEETICQYADIYCDKIFPLLDNNKGIDEYVFEDFEEIFEEARRTNNYSDSTMEQWVLLINRVFEAGVRYGICDDIFWGTPYARKNQKAVAEVEERATELLRIPRSLTVKEDELARKRLYANPETEHGEMIGLAIMNATGMRNNEVAGLDFGDMRQLRDYSGTWNLWVYKSTAIDTNQLQAGGKTKNANRILPIVMTLQAFIQARMDFVRAETATENVNIEDIPIVCRGNHYTERCSSSNLSNAGRKFFKNLKMEHTRIAFLENMVREQHNAGQIKEKDATTYLFRRNLATHLKNIGLSMGQIQYYMGHDVESELETRNFYTNEAKLQEIAEVLRNHPIEKAKHKGIPHTVVSESKVTANPMDIAHCIEFYANHDNAMFVLNGQVVNPTDNIILTIDGQPTVVMGLLKRGVL